MKRSAGLAFGLLVLGTVAWADGPYDGHDRAQRWDRAGHRLPDRDEMGSLRKIAQKLDSSMEKIYKHAKERAEDTSLNLEEREALRRLEMLSLRADAYEDTLERSTERPGLTLEDFERVLGSYLLVDEALPRLRRAELLHKDFGKVQDLMDDIVSYHGGYPRLHSRDYERLTERASRDLAEPADERRDFGLLHDWEREDVDLLAGGDAEGVPAWFQDE